MKAQISTDFVITLSLILVVFIVIIGITSGKFDQMNYEVEYADAKSTLEAFALNVNHIHLAQDGSSKQVDLSQDIQIDIYDNIAQITFLSDRHYSYPLLTSDISGITKGITGTITITNVNGGILIE